MKGICASSSTLPRITAWCMVNKTFNILWLLQVTSLVLKHQSPSFITTLRRYFQSQFLLRFGLGLWVVSLITRKIKCFLPSQRKETWGARVVKVTLLRFLHKPHPQLPFSVTTWSKIPPSLSYSPDFSPFTKPEGPLPCPEDLTTALCPEPFAPSPRQKKNPFF